ncbi:hypothetical protein [Bradyrhizobium iriomotense]|uniref:hypothetical protein n=1 Tax=Bradyrhizobium iriomotense TaxID=441950 RepID=UPI001B89E8B5|nr:hypothetical protein [Bradyrhizobium iriomotense]MBR1127432.1 hypothetical protein [Bradyrhizobium iriomotense]
MLQRLMTLIFLLAAGPAAAEAQPCKELPPGPQRFACASARNPGLSAKRDRCKEEGRKLGLTSNIGGKMGPYVQACMQRR